MSSLAREKRSKRCVLSHLFSRAESLALERRVSLDTHKMRLRRERTRDAESLLSRSLAQEALTLEFAESLLSSAREEKRREEKRREENSRFSAREEKRRAREC